MSWIVKMGMIAGDKPHTEAGCLEVDLEAGKIKMQEAKVEKDCRICHLGLESGNQESGVAIELGCLCKGDLASAHRQCADTWFKIKGNKICEICGSTATNVAGNHVVAEAVDEQVTEAGNPAPAVSSETRSFWCGHRILNFVLSCMVFAFVISWLFHFDVHS